MPLPPLPDNNTRRYWLQYTTGITEHSIMTRWALSSSDPSALAFYAAFLGAVQGLLSDEFTVLGVLRAEQGSNVRLPINPGNLPSFHGTDTDSPTKEDSPKELIFVGRGETSGRRWRLSLYGAQVGFPPDYRFEGVGLLPSLAAAIAVVEDFSGSLVTVAGDAIIPYPYVNINNNSYWETQARRS